LVKGACFGQKCNLGSKDQLFVTNDICVQKIIFGQGINFWSKIKFVVKFSCFGQKCNLESKYHFFGKNVKFVVGAQYLVKLQFVAKNENCSQKCKLRSKGQIVVKSAICDQKSNL
jgi:hypothetical protein